MEEVKIKKHRGRPKKVIPEGVDPSSIEGNNKTIVDPIMEPYYVSMDKYGFTVFEKIQPDLNFNPEAKEYIQAVGHYSNFAGCLTSIAKQKINSKSYQSIKDYISEYSQLLEELKTITKF